MLIGLTKLAWTGWTELLLTGLLVLVGLTESVDADRFDKCNVHGLDGKGDDGSDSTGADEVSKLDDGFDRIGTASSDTFGAD